MTKRFQGLLEMKIDTDGNKENNEDENCGTIHYDMILGSFMQQVFYFYLDLVCLTNAV